MAKGFRRAAGLILALWAVLTLSVPAARAAGTAENETGTAFTFTVEETTPDSSENTTGTKASPETGDSTALAAAAAAAAASGAVLLSCIRAERKRSKKTKYVSK